VVPGEPMDFALAQPARGLGHGDSLALGPLGVDLGQLQPDRLATLKLHTAVELPDHAHSVTLAVQLLGIVVVGRDRNIDIDRLLNRRGNAGEVSKTQTVQIVDWEPAP